MNWSIRSITVVALLVLTVGSAAAAFVASSQGWGGPSDQRLSSPNDRVAAAFAALLGGGSR
jgi:hypothetical protein